MKGIQGQDIGLHPVCSCVSHSSVCVLVCVLVCNQLVDPGVSGWTLTTNNPGHTARPLHKCAVGDTMYVRSGVAELCCGLHSRSLHSCVQGWMHVIEGSRGRVLACGCVRMGTPAPCHGYVVKKDIPICVCTPGLRGVRGGWRGVGVVHEWRLRCSDNALYCKRLERVRSAGSGQDGVLLSGCCCCADRPRSGWT